MYYTLSRVIPNAGLFIAEGGSVPKNVQVRPLSSSTMVIQWEEPETPNGQITVSICATPAET
jgi:hypothetical protein